MAVGNRSRIFARWLAPVMALLVVFQLTACGDKEPEQRKEFIDYLQNTVMRNGQNLPSLSEDQKQKLGNYANDYTVLVTYSHQFKQAIDNGLAPVVNHILDIRTPQDYLRKRDALQQSLGTLNMLGQQIQTAKAQADTAHAAMKHPDDLKVVYDKVYDNVVTVPANALMPVITPTASFAQDLVQVGDFLQQQGNQVTFNNNNVQFQTQQQVTQYNAMMSNLQAKQQTLATAQKVVQGQP